MTLWTLITVITVYGVWVCFMNVEGSVMVKFTHVLPEVLQVENILMVHCGQSFMQLCIGGQVNII